ncbi:alpha/beta-hydrolase, partial [Gaertneriomyces semiglobifer]
YVYQNTLIYPAHFPPGSRVEVAKPSDFRVEYDDLTIRTEDGELLKGYLIPHKLNGVRRTTSSDDVWAPITLLYCHANAGNMGHRLPIALALQRRYPINLVMYSYRGYGLSTGSPSENGLKTDTRAVMEFIKSHEKLSKTKIVIYGQSLGGAVAVDSNAGSPLDIAGLILENTFLSLPSLVPSIMPFTKYLPIKLLLTQIWDTQSLCRSLPSALPILLLSGSRDELVPPHHMRGLWETLSSSQSTDHITVDAETNVTLARFRDGTHNETCMQKGYFTTIVNFLNK